MTTINIQNAQENLCELISQVNETSIPAVIVNDGGKNAVMLPEEYWNSIQETLYLYSIPGMRERILNAMQEPLSECKIYDPNEEW